MSAEERINGDIQDRQLQVYARDLARLYRQERAVRQALEERQRDLEMLIETHGRLARCLDSASLIDLLLSIFIERLGAARACVYLAAARAGSLAYVAGAARETFPLPQRPPPISAEHPLHHHLIGEAQERLLVRADDAEYAAWIARTYPEQNRPTRVLCVSLPGRERPQGFIAVDNAAAEPIPSAREPTAILLAKQAGILLENVLRYERSETELHAIRELYSQEQQRLSARYQFDQLIGANHRMQEIFSLLRTVADVDVPVLILGETGTGKELVARALHYTSRRREKPFVSVNCAALPSELVESELFGHEKGAFTGALQRRIGKVEMAEGGTLFLDEIAEMPANLQAKLLRFLQDRTFERVGGNQPLQANVRIVAATNQDVETAVRENRLRMDLVYRLNTITVILPPLRERLDDIPLLVGHFVDEANRQYGCAIEGVAPEVFPILMRHHWPGNVRELKNVIDRAAILTQRGVITPETIQLASGALPTVADASREDALVPKVYVEEGRSLTELKREVVEQFERSYIDRLLRQHGGNVSQAARAAQIDKKNLIEKMRRYGISREQYL